MSGAAVSARGIAQRFGHQLALAPLDLELAPGDRLAVLGPNGAGKTSLLRILATAGRPAGGELQVGGVDALRRRAEARRLLGYVGHEPSLYPALTALENIEFFARLHGLGRAEAFRALARVGLEGLGARPAADLSRGLLQRLALARSLVHDPQFWVLDEPDASLDADGRDLLLELAAGRTVVLATHDHDLALRLCRRTLLLREGRVERPALEAVP